jgi:precorrin-6x reductase
VEVLVFGGTTEGRQLVEWLDARGTCDVVVCVTTDYGASLVAGGRHVTVVRGPLSDARKRELMEGHDFCCVVDATHPYAQHISQSVDELARAYHKDVVRVERASCAEGTWTSVASPLEAARHVAGVTGRVLLTTGTKDLATFVDALPDFAERLYVRVLPVSSALARVEALGVPASHVVAMQGPFSAALNAAVIRELDVRCMVAKQSGTAGGFEQKVQAARECGIELVVIERPPAAGGMSLAEARETLERRYGA